MPADTPDPTAETVAAKTNRIGDDATVAATERDPDASAGLANERYRLLNLLGKGGMGEVLCAVDAQIGREVAIKRMRVAPSPGAVARFLREARVQGRLDHPAIVPVHELADDAEGRPYFVMKRLAGTTLAEVLADRDRDPLRFGRQRLLRVFADVCLAVEFAHSRGIVHRDLKPSNIMLGDFGEVYVLDWGVARVLGAEGGDDDDAAWADTVAESGGIGGTTEVGTILGTPGYISPEQLRGEPVDGRADVFSLGCILFEILSGHPLFAGEHAWTGPLEDGAAPSRSKAGADTPPELDTAWVGATARDRTTRTRSARELGAAVQRFLDGDRDLAVRRELAARHLTAARAALARGDGEAERAEAMREAGRALALDPAADDAATLVGRLMLEPPRELPQVVEARLVAHDEQIWQTQVRLDRLALAVYAAFVPALLLLGVRDARYLVAAVVAIAANGAAVWCAARWRTTTMFLIAALLNAMLIGVFARIGTPFLVGPGLAVGTVMAFSFHPRFSRAGWLSVIFIAGSLGPLLLEHLGVLSSTMATVNDGMLLTSPAVHIRMPHVEIIMVLYISLTIAACGYVAHEFAVAQSASRRTLQLQAWHLAQLAGLEK